MVNVEVPRERFNLCMLSVQKTEPILRGLNVVILKAGSLY